MEKLNKITILTLLGLTTAPVVLNNIETYLNSHYVLSQIAHANTPATDIDSLTETAHTPVYHLETSQGWSNDLQTISWNEKGGYYDIYFLHSVDGATNPFGPNGQDWYHCTTKDFVHFSSQNSAIPSNVKNSMSSNDQSWKSAWTGSVVQNQGNIAGVPKGDYVAYFSGLKKADGSQNIWAAWSDDNGRTFSHVLNNGNPVLPYNASFASNDKDNERDAYVCYWNGKLLMYCAEGDKLGVYQSKDGINWSKADPACQSKVLASTFMKGVDWTDANKPVECPCLKMMTTPDGQTKAVLFYGDKTPQDGQTTGTYYVVGHLDQNGLFAAETNAKRLDLGSDYYGSNFSGTDDLNKPNASIDTMGWVGNWSYTSQGVHNSQDGTGPYTGRLGSYTLPRKLTLNNDLTLSSNIDDSNLHLTKTNDFNNVTKDKPATKDGKLNILGQDADYGPIYTLADIPNLPANGEYDLHFTNPDGYRGRIYIDIWQGADYVKLNFDPTNNNFRVAGKATELNDDLSGTSASSAYYDGMLGNGNGYAEHLDSNETYPKDFHLKVFTDKDSVEFQFPNGQTYTIARYAINDNQDFKVYTQDPTGKNTLSLAVNTVDTLSKPATGNSSSSESAPSSSAATTKPSEDQPATGTATSTKPVDKPSTDNKPATGTPTGNSNKPTDSKPVASSAKPSDITSISSSSNKAQSSSSSQSENKPAASSSASSTKPADTKPASSSSSKDDNKPTTGTATSSSSDKTSSNSDKTSTSSAKPSTSSSATDQNNKPATTSSSKSDTDKATSPSSTKPTDNKTSSSNSAKNDSNKPAAGAAGTSADLNKATSSSAKNDSKSSSSTKQDDKPATTTSSNKSTATNPDKSSSKADNDKTVVNSGKDDNNSKSEASNKADTESAQGKSSTKEDSNKVTDKKSDKSSSSDSSKSSMRSKINAVKSTSSSTNSKHSGESENELVKSSSDSNNNSEKNDSSVKNEVSSESSSASSAKSDSAVNESGKSNKDSNDKTVNGSSVKAEAKDGADNESDANVSSSSATETATPANGNQSNNVFQEQTAGGTNDNSEPHQGAVSNSDDTYSEQKAAMLAKTNAKAEQGGIIAAIGAAIATIAGWFGLKKKD